MRCPDAYALL